LKKEIIVEQIRKRDRTYRHANQYHLILLQYIQIPNIIKNLHGPFNKTKKLEKRKTPFPLAPLKPKLNKKFEKREN